LGLPPFDYINCIGVLHHLPDPDAGLGALKSVLKDGVALGLMLYDKIGRSGIYQMQELMRAINVDEPSLVGEIANAKAVMAQLPATNWFKRCDDLWRGDMNSDADLYDIVLHSQDRANSVEEIFAWMADRHGFNLDFSAVGRGRIRLPAEAGIDRCALALARQNRTPTAAPSVQNRRITARQYHDPCVLRDPLRAMSRCLW
jgi:SAM-dependent methyltransferase